MKQRLAKVAVCLLAVTLCCGCARMTVQTGKGITDLTGIERGQTTRANVLQRYGPPQVIDRPFRSASFGKNHLAYEARKNTGWYVMLYLPFYNLPLVGFFNGNEEADTTVFLFDNNGKLVDFAQTKGPVGKRVAYTLLTWVMSGIAIK